MYMGMGKLAVWSAFFCKIKGFWCEKLRGKLVWKCVPERFEWGKTGFLLGSGKFCMGGGLQNEFQGIQDISMNTRYFNEV